MTRQLSLIDASELEWRLDERTKEQGRRGLGDARAALRQARPPLPAAHRSAR